MADLDDNIAPPRINFLDQDLRAISKWAHDELFETVKFLYRGEDELKSTLPKIGNVYKLFVSGCRDNLPGVKASVSQGDAYKLVYVNNVWEHAKKKKVVHAALSIRRSTIYTAMQIKFEELCNFCAENELIFPALEALEERLDNPNTYFIFYDYFLRATVGDGTWKRNFGLREQERMKKKARLSGADSNSSVSSSKTKRMASPVDEAFALIVLKNNYYAWLLAAKEKGSRKVLLTDYDMAEFESSGSRTMETLAERLLQGAMINISNDENGRSYDLDHVAWKPQDDDSEEVKVRYNDAVTHYGILNTALRSKVSASKEYKFLSDCVQALRTTTDTTQNKANKRKKMMKSLKCFTGVREENEPRYKGWSKRTFPILHDLKEEIIKEKGLYKLFGKAYHKIHEVQRGLLEEIDTTASQGILSDEQHERLYAADDDDEDSSIMSDDDESNDSNVCLDDLTGGVVVEL